jgi:hypothetical protein
MVYIRPRVMFARVALAAGHQRGLVQLVSLVPEVQFVRIFRILSIHQSHRARERVGVCVSNGRTLGGVHEAGAFVLDLQGGRISRGMHKA